VCNLYISKMQIYENECKYRAKIYKWDTLTLKSVEKNNTY